MRFSLSQLHVCMPNTVQSDHVEVIEEDMSNLIQAPSTSNDSSSYPTTVRGLYLRRRRRRGDKTTKKNEYTLFWIYGGAYLAGDTTGNSAAADWFSSKCDDVDVFIPEFRLAPQANIHEVLWDVSLAYCWLCNKRKRTVGTDPSKIVLLGISSGAAIGVRLMQYIAEHQQRNEVLEPPFIAETVRDVTMPQAAVLFGPYVDFTTEEEDYDKTNSSFHHYSRLDLVVTESVQEYGLPYLDDFIPDGKSKVE